MPSKQQSKTIKINKVLVHRAKKDYEFETTLEYKTADGYKGYIVRIRSLKEK